MGCDCSNNDGDASYLAKNCCKEENPSCFKKLVRSLMVRTFSINELIANLYCAFRDIAYSIRQFRDKYEEILEDKSLDREYLAEIFSFDEAVAAELRPILRAPFSGTLLKLHFFSYQATEEPLMVTVFLNGSAIATFTSNFDRFELPFNIPVSAGDLIDVSTQYPSDYDSWTGLSCYVKFAEG